MRNAHFFTDIGQYEWYAAPPLAKRRYRQIKCPYDFCFIYINLLVFVIFVHSNYNVFCRDFQVKFQQRGLFRSNHKSGAISFKKGCVILTKNAFFPCKATVISILSFCVTIKSFSTSDTVFPPQSITAHSNRR